MAQNNFLGIDLPIIQAPMAGVQDSSLTIAVSRAGGLGSLACASLGQDALRDEIRAIREHTENPVNLNFFSHEPPELNVAWENEWRSSLDPFFTEYGIPAEDRPSAPGLRPFDHTAADVLEEFRPEVVSFHFGLPADDLLKRIHSWGSKVLACATTIDEAKWLEARGVDGIIAQGLEAGGHRGMFLTDDLTTQTGTFALLPQITRQIRKPVIAAGGIASAGAVAAALSFGAVAVQVGTAYLLCPEARTSQIHRSALKSATAGHTAITNVFTGRPARSIVNRIIREVGPINNAAPSFPLAGQLLATLRSQAERQGLDDFTPLWCGQNAAGCEEIPAAELTRKLASEILTERLVP